MMNQTWQLPQVNNQLSEVVAAAVQSGPQVIIQRGVKMAMVISYADYLKLKKPRQKLATFFQTSPLVGLELERDNSPVRDDIIL